MSSENHRWVCSRGFVGKCFHDFSQILSLKQIHEENYFNIPLVADVQILLEMSYRGREKFFSESGILSEMNLGMTPGKSLKPWLNHIVPFINYPHAFSPSGKNMSPLSKLLTSQKFYIIF